MARVYRSTYFANVVDACNVKNSTHVFVELLPYLRSALEVGIGAGVLVFYLTKRRKVAAEGSKRAASFMILPSYVWFLWFSAFLVALHLVNIVFRQLPFEDQVAQDFVQKFSLIFRVVLTILDEWVIASAVLLFMKRGAGLEAVRKAMAMGAVLSALSGVPLVVYVAVGERNSEHRAIMFMVCACDSAFCVAVLGLWLLPASALPPGTLKTLLEQRRPAANTLLRFLAPFVTVAAVSDLLVLVLDRDDGDFLSHLGTCAAWGNDVLFHATWPLALYVSLRRDSNYWRGVGNNKFLQRWLARGAAEASAEAAAANRNNKGAAGGSGGGGLGLDVVAGGSKGTLGKSMSTLLTIHGDGSGRDLGSLLAAHVSSSPHIHPIPRMV
jgi:hypothetical protein